MRTPIELVSYLESLPEPHILCDRDYRIIAANRAYRRSFDVGDELIGNTCFAVSHHYDAPCDLAGETCPLQKSLISGRREKVLHVHHTPRGEAYVNIELSPVHDAAGELLFFVEKMEPMGLVGFGDSKLELVGKAPAFRRMLELMSRVSTSDVTVMLQGESGAGKELVANAIHNSSRRAEHPFIAVDCSGLSETLFESELFGHEKGAFTGASARRIGLVESASGGALFLDELGDIPLGMQVKLLRLLETGTFRRVGSNDFHKADIRLISATHRDLRSMVADGRFRQDLYYRLSTFPIHLPALRERREDIPLLARALLQRVAPRRNLSLSKAALAALAQYDFPGNVRELRNILERASLLGDGEIIDVQHLPPEINEAAAPAARASQTSPDAAATSASTLAEIEAAMLRQRLARHGGNRKQLADELGISERTLYRKLRSLRQNVVLPK